MQRFLSLLLKQSIVLSTLAAIGCIVLFATSGLVQSASTQATKRSFESKIPAHVPLKIKIKKEKEEKALDLNNKDWFRDIEIEVTNTSNKPIYFLSLNVELADLAPARPNALRTFFLGYGRGEFYEQNTKPIPGDIPIAPNATHTFVIDEDQRNGFEKWRSQNSGRDAFKLQMSINHLSFGDGTGFTTLGALPFPFKDNPEELGRQNPGHPAMGKDANNFSHTVCTEPVRTSNVSPLGQSSTAAPIRKPEKPRSRMKFSG